MAWAVWGVHKPKGSLGQDFYDLSNNIGCIWHLGVSVSLPEMGVRCELVPRRKEGLEQQGPVPEPSPLPLPLPPQGCVVIRYTAPWHLVFFSESLGIPSLRVLAQRLLELLFHYEIEKEPLLFHVFSNAGVMLYRYVLDLLQTHQRFCRLRVVGTIFDSGPGHSNLLGALRALAAILQHRPAALRCLLLAAFALVVVLFHVLLAPLTALFHTHFYHRLQDAGSRWPELYLYSKADKVVLARDVERMVEARLSHQVLVRSVDFVSSAHVSHLRDYPTYYTSLCANFMHTCMHC